MPNECTKPSPWRKPPSSELVEPGRDKFTRRRWLTAVLGCGSMQRVANREGVKRISVERAVIEAIRERVA